MLIVPLGYLSIYNTILYCTILYYIILYYTILYYTILYYTILYYTILYCTILYYTIPYYTILYTLYYTILYYAHIVVFHWYLRTYLLTPWSRVHLEKLTGFQPVKKFPAYHRTRRFITAFTSARQLSLS